MKGKVASTLVLGMALSSLAHAEVQEIIEVDYAKADYKQLAGYQAAEEKEAMELLSKEEVANSEASLNNSKPLEKNQQNSEKLLDDSTSPFFEPTTIDEEEQSRAVADRLLEQ